MDALGKYESIFLDYGNILFFVNITVIKLIRSRIKFNLLRCIINVPFVEQYVKTILQFAFLNKECN